MNWEDYWLRFRVEEVEPWTQRVQGSLRELRHTTYVVVGLVGIVHYAYNQIPDNGPSLHYLEVGYYLGGLVAIIATLLAHWPASIGVGPFMDKGKTYTTRYDVTRYMAHARARHKATDKIIGIKKNLVQMAICGLGSQLVVLILLALERSDCCVG